MAVNDRDGGGLYLVIDDGAHPRELAPYAGTPDLRCYSVREADGVNATIARSATDQRTRNSGVGRHGCLWIHRADHRRVLAVRTRAGAIRQDRRVDHVTADPARRPPDRRHLRTVPPLLRPPTQQFTDPPFGAVAGLLGTVRAMIEDGATHIGVATDHVIESFRNASGRATRRAPALTRAAGAVPAAGGSAGGDGRRRWPMVELEADDALASAAYSPRRDRGSRRCRIWTPDKDLAQCVVATASCRWIGAAAGTGRGGRYGSKFGVAQCRFRTTSRWLATPRMAILAWQASARDGSAAGESLRSAGGVSGSRCLARTRAGSAVQDAGNPEGLT